MTPGFDHPPTQGVSLASATLIVIAELAARPAPPWSLAVTVRL